MIPATAIILRLAKKERPAARLEPIKRKPARKEKHLHVLSMIRFITG